MKFTRTALALAGATALVVSGMATTAAADTDVQIYGGTTTITTTAKALPKITTAGIVMTSAKSAYVTDTNKARQTFEFGIEAGSNVMLEDDPAGAQPVGSITGGRILHKGDITFFNTKNGKDVAVGDFIINLKKGKVFATSLNGDPLADHLAVFVLQVLDPPLVPVYDNADPAKATTATVSGVKLLMTSKAAGALNDALATDVFAKDLKFGKSVSVADIVAPPAP